MEDLNKETRQRISEEKPEMVDEEEEEAEINKHDLQKAYQVSFLYVFEKITVRHKKSIDFFL